MSEPLHLAALAGFVSTHHDLSGLPAGAAAWALARLVLDQLDPATKGRPRLLPLLVVAPTRDEADRLCMELRFHLGPAEVPVHRLPCDDTRPWDGLSPHPELNRERLVALRALREGDPAVIVTPARSLLARVLAPSSLAELSLSFTVGDSQPREARIAALVARGYLVVPRVDEPGTVAPRGAVLDIWPTGETFPIRCELFDDDLESIHRFDPATGKSTGKLQKINMLPAREAVVNPAALARAAQHTETAVARSGFGQLIRKRVLTDLSQGLWFPAAEDYLCALHPLVSLLSLCPNVAVVEPGEVAQELDKADHQANQRWAQLSPEERPVVLPEARFLSLAEVQASLAEKQPLRIGGLVMSSEQDPVVFDARENNILRVGKGDLTPAITRISTWLEEGWQVALVADSHARLERVSALFVNHGLKAHPKKVGEFGDLGELVSWIGTLDRGFHSPASKLAILTADELFGARSRSLTRHAKAKGQTLTGAGLAKLKIGDFVVHVRHGVGAFAGLKRIAMPLGGEVVEQDFAEITYRDGDRMYVPVTRLDQLHPYRAVGDKVPTLDRLGGQTWSKRKDKVRDRVAGLAIELLRIHAAREVAPGHAIEGTPEAFVQFEQAFPFMETPDQESAIQDVLDDLQSTKPMDRLIIGDVGFGKTEVAMRAAMRVVLAGRQVAVLCPTTVLAYQHWRTFNERFSGTGVQIALHSSFRSNAELSETSKGVREGRVQILIGTHGILGRQVKFHDLGLVVVDEEHRFGVKQKEKLKKLAVSASGLPCDYLAMSATPIPRTLHLALSGLRVVSTLRTPPEGRRPVQTRVARWQDGLIRQEILHELRRGGQVFFVHNRVETIERVARELGELVPEARLLVGHGQMEPADLERVLVDFVRGEAHILVCSTIVESGIDMPNVNTILVNRADQLGLAQLYQLRGRVGRGSLRGYCTLLVPEDEAAITPKAVERLRVLQENQELGSGMLVAEADLEIRGAGDLLGESQHGAIQEVGLDTYAELLEEAVAAARGDLARTRINPELELPVAALIPESWIEDVQDRLAAYARIGAARTVPELRDYLTALEDQYGEAPPPVLHLGWQAEARLRCRTLGVERIAFLKGRFLVELHASTVVKAERVRDLARTDPARFALEDPVWKSAPPAEPGRRLVVRFNAEEGAWPFRLIDFVLRIFEREESAPRPVFVSPEAPKPASEGPKRRIIRPPSGRGERKW